MRRRRANGRRPLFKNLKLGHTIYGVVLLLTIVAELISIVGVTGMQTYNTRIHQMRRIAHAAVFGEQIGGLVLSVVMDSHGVEAATDPAAAAKFAPPIEKNLALIQQAAPRWIEVAPPEDRAVMERARAELDQFVKSHLEMLRLLRAGSLPEARAAENSDQNRANRAALNTALEGLATMQAGRIGELADAAQSFYASRVVMLIGLAAVALALAGLALLIVISRITRPISQLTERVTENIRKVAIAATQASSAVSQVSDGSNVQLSALKQSASALGQSTEAIAEVARSTQLASEQAKEAANLVADGIRQVDRMVEVVNAISDNSTQVSQIAGAISQIASQTNMLALNAAIEAARAGEHGKGFAVVAEEVRKLAENSGSLAQEITSLVKHATDAAERGVIMAREASDNMHQIANGVQQSDRLVGAIATAMEEQQATVSGINTNVTELTRIGQSNATAAEEITATMLDLSKLAERSRGDVDNFKAVGL
ncbi:MAG TPA: methyl-accepting chemotaxis protein [Stellaceae bacterium]|nr:methyl-accepting chemotaxis protein [Stellaceae bacterium]